MTTLPPAVTTLSTSLARLGWISDLLVAGSLATGDYVPGVSDLDLVAVTDGPVDAVREISLRALHTRLDRDLGPGVSLGCAYVAEGALPERGAQHPTWTHGQLVRRALSGICRAELVRHGFAVFGRSPTTLFPPMTDEDIRGAARDELTGYWKKATRWPWLWLEPSFAELSLTSMARGRYTLRTGRLLTKTDAIEHVRAPDWLVEQLRERRQGSPVTPPRLPTAWIAWRDARQTLAPITPA